MSQVKIIVLSTIVCIFLSSGCSQNGPLFFSTPIQTPSPAPSSTPYPLASCNENESYVGTWTLEQDGMLFEAFLCSNNTLIAVFHNQEFSDPITINQTSHDAIEYSWEVFVDVDADKSTGLSERNYTGIPGAEYMLTLAHRSNGGVKTIPFNQAFQTNAWHYDGENIVVISRAEFYADKASQLIILKGNIPEITSNSRLYFYHIHLTSDNQFSYRTEWVTSSKSSP